MDGEVIGLVSAAGRVVQSDDERLAALFDAHHQRLYRLARRLARSPDEARDMVQETFLRAAGSVGRVPHGATSEEAWLVRVLVNIARDGWRRRAVRMRFEQQPGDAVRHARTPQDAESALVARGTVWAALAHLPPRRRAAIVLYEIEGVPIPEIARLLGVAAVTVRWNLSRGRKQMAAIIGGGKDQS